MNRLVAKQTFKTLKLFTNVNNMTKITFSTEIPKNILVDTISADKQTECGAVYDKKPFKMSLEAGKKYSWCSCGKSKTQPMCDGTHKINQLKIKLKPIRFAVAESKDYWLCNCKHTNNRPFCDGSHKSKTVEEASSVVRQ
ncbi:PREDICTED: CDGSH iron-sulfur domain-containing protein 3, mitochondrial [Nicrophorus vespilloides]|uniref:CDGSH iron-sulfur domain-containing protein 3, mitochondrial n=1 Tax=Nicrophorus vespilloides TaxID=110193 RepID=A0ABM1MLM8_NICVS|nr:PREDICTED: CDGSH iron-sulfur domain-containing protein 3, mitochondrial [Nicrophorus vespilloides]